MRGAVMGRHVAVFGLDQDLAVSTDQNGAEGMVAVRHRTAGDIKGMPQEVLVQLSLRQALDICHRCPPSDSCLTHFLPQISLRNLRILDCYANRCPLRLKTLFSVPPCGGQCRSGWLRLRAPRRRTGRETSRPDDPTIRAIRRGPR